MTTSQQGHLSPLVFKRKSHSFLAQSPSGIDQSPQEENLPLCAKFHLRTFTRGAKYSAGVIMNNYLVVLAQDTSVYISRREDNTDYDEYNSEDDEPATLLAFNLQDHTVQEVEMNSDTFGFYRDYYIFLKYGENQIIKYGGDPSDPYGSEGDQIYCITIESFERIPLIFCKEISKRGKAFEVKSKAIYGKTTKELSHQTAQIYEDYMYVYGKANDSDELWSFDLEMREWQRCETTGEAPPKLTKTPKSFIFEDNLYVYGGWKTKFPLRDIFMLNLNSMKWTNIELESEENEKSIKERWDGTVYKDHLAALEKLKNPEETVLRFYSLRAKKTRSDFNIKGPGKPSRKMKAITCGLMSYRNWILNLATEGKNDDLIVAMVNIEKFGISAPKSTEQEYESGLFLNQNESDVAFKIDEQVIPAHKEILMKKSEYFENLFNSGMAESKQEIIEIKDCEYEVFKGLLQWIYQDKVDLKDANQAISLHFLADKYLQKGLPEKCLDVLVSMINMDNVITIYNFASQENNLYLKSWCLKCVLDKLTLQNVANFIKDLEKLKEKNEQLRDQGFLFILDNFLELYENEKGQMQIYEDFIIKNIEMNTIPTLANFLGRHPKKQRKTFERQDDEKYESDSEDDEEEKEIEDEQEDDSGSEIEEKDHFEKCTAQVKEAVFSFIQKNTKVIKRKKMWKDFPQKFMWDLFLHTNENFESQVLKNERKRMEPNQKDFDEEQAHELKKTKK